MSSELTRAATWPDSLFLLSQPGKPTASMMTTSVARKWCKLSRRIFIRFGISIVDVIRHHAVKGLVKNRPGWKDAARHLLAVSYGSDLS
jgi:hypothetical protein